VAKNETHFEYADRGATSVYKFRFPEDPNVYVWFEFAGDGASLYSTARPGPFRPDDALGPAPFGDLDELLASRRTTRAQWIADLMAQFGERLAWTYP
jgi:hypothetical protein